MDIFDYDYNLLKQTRLAKNISIENIAFDLCLAVRQIHSHVFVVHGEPSASIHFAQTIRESLNWNDLIIPTLQSTFDIT